MTTKINVSMIDGLPRRSLLAYGVTAGVTTDQSSAIQAAITAAAADNFVLEIPGFFYAKGLSLPANTHLAGTEQDTCGFILPAGANTYIAASAGYISNSTTVQLGGSIRNLQFDGNKANQTSAAPLLIDRTYRAIREYVRFLNSKGRGVLLTAESADGTDVTNGMAENYYHRCAFDQNDEEGLYGLDDTANQLADGEIIGCVFNNNGGTTKYNCVIERGAGWKFLKNQTYAGGIGDLHMDKAGRCVIANNHFDINSVGATSGNVYALDVETAGHASAIVVGNIFHNSKASAGSVTWQHAILRATNADSCIALTGNVFYSENFTHTAWTVTGSGHVVDEGNSYYQSTQPSPSAQVRRGLVSDSAGQWTIEEKLNLPATVEQYQASAFHNMTGSASAIKQVRTALDSSTPPQFTLGKARGTPENPTSVTQYQPLGRVGFLGYASSAWREAVRLESVMQAASPSSSDMEADFRIYTAGTGSGTATERVRVNGTFGLRVPLAYTNTSASAANVFVDSDGDFMRSTSSAKYKTDITPISLETSAAIIAGLKPIRYRSLGQKDNREWSWYGFLAEDVAQVDPRLVLWNKGDPDGVFYERVIPHLVAEIQRMGQRLEALEGGAGGPPPVLEKHRLEGEGDVELRIRLRKRLTELRNKMFLHALNEKEADDLAEYERSAWLGVD